jgi:hypothetical protein
VQNADPARLDSLANAVIRASSIRPFHYTVSPGFILDYQELVLIPFVLQHQGVSIDSSRPL